MPGAHCTFFIIHSASFIPKCRRSNTNIDHSQIRGDFSPFTYPFRIVKPSLIIEFSSYISQFPSYKFARALGPMQSESTVIIVQMGVIHIPIPLVSLHFRHVQPVYPIRTPSLPPFIHVSPSSLCSVFRCDAIYLILHYLAHLHALRPAKQDIAQRFVISAGIGLLAWLCGQMSVWAVSTGDGYVSWTP